MAGKPDTYIAAVFDFGARDNISFGATRYLAALGGTTLGGPTAANEMAVAIPRSGKLKNLYWGCHQNGISGTSGTCKITVRVNGANTALEETWTLPAQPPGGTKTAEVLVNAGDRVSVLVQAAGTAGNIQKLRVSFEFEVDSTNPWWLNGQDVYYDGAGRVAVGTDTPDSDPAVILTVDGMIKSNIGGFEFPDGTVQTTAFGVLGGINALTGAGGTPPDAVYVDSNGRVGIGIGSARMPQEKLTLAPGSNLAVEMATPENVQAIAESSGNLPTGTYYFQIVAEDGAGQTTLASPKNPCPVNNPVTNRCSVSWSPVLGATQYRVYVVDRPGGEPDCFYRTAQTPFSYNNQPGYIEETVPTVATAYLNKLTASGSSWLLGGNIGIGTTNPQAKLEVAGNAVVDGNVGIGRTDPQAKLDVFFDGAPQLRIGDASGVFWQLWCGGNFHLRQGTATDRFFIEGATGNVGIGTTNPRSRFEVKGDYYTINARLASSEGTYWEFGDVNDPSAYMVVGAYQGVNNIDNKGRPLYIRNGGVFCDLGVWSGSSKRLKTNIQPIKDALNKVRSLQGVSFDWKADGKHSIGLIAEDVGEVIPEVVAYEENGADAKGVDYSRLVAVLIEAVKEQQKQIDELKATVKSLAAGKAGGGR